MLLATPEEGYTAACAAIRDMDLREAIRVITNPVLVIVGRHDPLTTPGLGALVASAIQGAKLVTLDTAHMSCIEDPEGFDQAAIEFLTTEAPVMGDETKHDAGSEAPKAPQPLQRPLEKPRVPPQPAAPGPGGGMPSHGISTHPAPAAPRPPVPAGSRRCGSGEEEGRKQIRGQEIAGQENGAEIRREENRGEKAPLSFVRAQSGEKIRGEKGRETGGEKISPSARGSSRRPRPRRARGKARPRRRAAKPCRVARLGAGRRAASADKAQ